MKERPILFSAPMVRAVLAGTKTQTRRAIRLQTGDTFDEQALVGAVQEWRPVWDKVAGAVVGQRAAAVRCPYGMPGDRLWVRETLKPWSQDAAIFAYAADDTRVQGDGYNYPVKPGRGYVPSIHLHRCWSRLILDVVDVRVQRLQDITHPDCVAEGAPGGHGSIPGYAYSATPVEHFQHVWETIHGLGSWAANPWVWAVTFRREQST